MKGPDRRSSRVCIVSGGTRGIGLALTKGLLSDGHRVSIWARDAARGQEVLRELAASDDWVDFQACDVCNPAAVAESFQRTLARFGAVHGFIANAAVNGSRSRFVDRPLEEWDLTIRTNLLGVVHGFQVAARHMIARAEAGDSFGRLIAVSSLASLVGAAQNESYGATKAAINSLVRAIAVELARYGVTANAILPGYVETELSAEMFGNPKFKANVLPRVPMRRFGMPDDHAGIVNYLMSDSSGYHTGQCFVIDGGYSIY